MAAKFTSVVPRGIAFRREATSTPATTTSSRVATSQTSTGLEIIETPAKVLMRMIEKV
jgi:hypothetical protein